MLLDDEIRKAGQLNTKKYRQIGMGLLVIVSIVAVVLGSVQWYSHSQTSNVNPQQLLAETTPFSPQQNEQARDQFKRDLVEFEQGLAFLDMAVGIKAWSPDRVEQLSHLKVQALNNFANGEYALALQQLQNATQQTRDLMADWDRAFNSKLAQATEYFDQGDERRAQLSARQALQIKPDNDNVQALLARLKVLPTIKQLLADINIAQVENNWQRQAELLQNIIELDPQRLELVERKKIVDETLKDIQFSEAIKKGLESVEQGKVNAARKALNQAQSIDPDRRELSVLKTKINKAVANTAQTDFFSQIDQFISKDKWQPLQQLLKSSAGKYSNNPKIQQITELTGQLLSLEKNLDNYLTRPDRLTDTRINAHATGLIQNNELLAAVSPRITGKLKRLEHQLKILSVAVTVTVHSDGKTEISIVGQGHLGKQQLNQIQLKPGNYVFRGDRPGYRSKHIKISIQPNAINQQLTIICNERI